MSFESLFVLSLIGLCGLVIWISVGRGDRCVAIAVLALAALLGFVVGGEYGHSQACRAAAQHQGLTVGTVPGDPFSTRLIWPDGTPETGWYSVELPAEAGGPAATEPATD